MKHLIFALIVCFLASSAMAIPPPPPLGMGTYPANEDQIKANIIQTYMNTLNRPGPAANPLKEEVDKLEKAAEPGGVQIPTEADMLLIYSGKGSAATYTHTYLVGVPLTRSGTGLFRSLQIYFQANVYVDYNKNETNVVLTHLVQLAGK